MLKVVGMLLLGTAKSACYRIVVVGGGGRPVDPGGDSSLMKNSLVTAQAQAENKVSDNWCDLASVDRATPAGSARSRTAARHPAGSRQAPILPLKRWVVERRLAGAVRFAIARDFERLALCRSTGAGRRKGRSFLAIARC
jgi:hypothetical protein